VPEKLLPIARTLDIGVKLLGAVRLVYPEATSVYPVTGAMYQHVIDGTLEVSSVQPTGIGKRNPEQ